MRTILAIALAAIFGSAASGEDLVDAKVPWSGTIRNVTLKETLARITGWAEGSHGQTITFGDKLWPKVGDKVIEELTILDEPRPTYSEVLMAAYGGGIVIKSSKDGIEIWHLITRRWRLSFSTVAKLKRSKRWNSQGITAELKERGGVLSQHAVIMLVPSSELLMVTGTVTDLAEIDRLLNN